MSRDLYEILGVARTAGQDEIKTAYRRLARQYHPDVNPNNPEAEEELIKEIGSAYNVLSDPDKRARYDQTGSVDDVPQDPFMSGSVNDLFDMFFGGMGGQAQRGPRTAFNGEDLQVRVNLTLKDILDATEKEVKVNRRAGCTACSGTGVEGGGQPERCQQCGGTGVITRTQQTFIGAVRTQTACPVCQGAGVIIKNPCTVCKGQKRVQETSTLKVTIPAGVENGSTMRVPGHGNDGIGGGRPGDLYVALSVAEDDRFEREGQDLHTTHDVSYAQAAIGDELSIPGLDETYDLELPHGSQPDDVLTVRNGGLPPLHGGQRGNLYVHLGLTVPKKLNDEQKDLIIRLAKAIGEQAPKGDRGGLLGHLFGKKKP